MNSWKWVWRISAWLSAAASLLLIVGFVYGAKELMFPRPNLAESNASAEAPLTKREPAAEDGSYRIAAIGDSLAKGTGDTTGQGFARRTADLLASANKQPVQFLNNLGINGMTTKELLEELKQPGAQYVLKKANIILLSIGANDLFQGGAALQTGSGAPNTAALEKALPDAEERLGQTLDKLREINPTARIIYVGLYNPFGDVESLKEEGNQGITSWNAKAASLIVRRDNMMMTPTFDLFQRDPAAYLSSDHFHPNSAGYERIARRIAQGIE